MIEKNLFWQWAYSDFLSNSLRGVLAEYIVATAIKCTDKLRAEWDAYDLVAPDGTKIEVKSSAYLQTWKQDKFSTIQFDIAPKKSWDAKTNTSQYTALRSADVYVFCVFVSTDKNTANPLDENQWFFLICSSDFLNKEFGNQKTAVLSSLEKKGLKRVYFDELRSEIERHKRLSSV